MSNLIQRATAAHAYPLLAKQLLHAPIACAREQEIVYRDLRRHSYAEFRLAPRARRRQLPRACVADTPLDVALNAGLV